MTGILTLPGIKGKYREPHIMRSSRINIQSKNQLIFRFELPSAEHDGNDKRVVWEPTRGTIQPVESFHSRTNYEWTEKRNQQLEEVESEPIWRRIRNKTQQSKKKRKYDTDFPETGNKGKWLSDFCC